MRFAVSYVLQNSRVPLIPDILGFRLIWYRNLLLLFDNIALNPAKLFLAERKYLLQIYHRHLLCVVPCTEQWFSINYLYQGYIYIYISADGVYLISFVKGYLSTIPLFCCNTSFKCLPSAPTALGCDVYIPR